MQYLHGIWANLIQGEVSFGIMALRNHPIPGARVNEALIGMHVEISKPTPLILNNFLSYKIIPVFVVSTQMYNMF
jgi:hypothetical protein